SLAEVLHQHSLYYVGFLHEREEDVKGRRQLAALEEIEAEVDNIRQAWYQALEDEDIERIEQASFSLLRYVHFRSRQVEFVQMFADAETALRPMHSAHQGYGRLLIYYSSIFDLLNPEAEHLLREALATCRAEDDLIGIAQASRKLSEILFELGKR